MSPPPGVRRSTVYHTHTRSEACVFTSVCVVRVSRRTEAVEAAELPSFLQSGADAAQLLPEHSRQTDHEALQLRRRHLRDDNGNMYHPVTLTYVLVINTEVYYWMWMFYLGVQSLDVRHQILQVRSERMNVEEGRDDACDEEGRS